MRLTDFNPSGHKSLECVIPSCVRFNNISGNSASIIWYDYRCRRVLYSLLDPGEFMDMNTYVTHPWTFETSSTGDRLDGNHCKTFYPMDENKKIVNITYPLYSLKERSLQIIRECLELSDHRHQLQLELPRPLQDELEVLRVKKQCAQIHSGELVAPLPDSRADHSTPHTCTFQSCHHILFAQHRRRRDEDLQNQAAARPEDSLVENALLPNEEEELYYKRNPSDCKLDIYH